MGWEIDVSDAVPGQPVSSARTNAIRDRGVHLIPTVAALPTDVADGGLAYVTETASLWLRNAGTWINLGAPGDRVSFSFINNGSVTLTTSSTPGVQLMTATFSVPAGWNTWGLEASWSCSLVADSGLHTDYRNLVDSAVIGGSRRVTGLGTLAGTNAFAQVAGNLRTGALSGTGEHTYAIHANQLAAGSATVQQRQMAGSVYRLT